MPSTPYEFHLTMPSLPAAPETLQENYVIGAPRIRRYLQHPLCKLMPPMRPNEFRSFVKTIREDGLLVPIVIADGMILDGYMRDEACFYAGVVPRYCELPHGVDARGFFIAVNLCRASYSPQQRVEIKQRLLAWQQANRTRAGGVGGEAESRR